MQQALLERAPVLADDFVDLAGHHAQILFEQLHAQADALISPAARKQLREFSLAETSFFTGIAESDIRALLRTHTPDQTFRRYFKAEEFDALREAFDRAASGSVRVSRGRQGSEKLQVISVANFKGGACKTTTAAHLAQHLALRGYKTLAIDLDPQGSLTALHGIQPELEVGPKDSLFGAITFEGDTRPIEDIIRKTHFPNLDIIPAALELMEFEYETPLWMKTAPEIGTRFFLRIEAALDRIDPAYDVVIFDCPPQLGWLTMAALCSSTSALIPVHPQMLDILSMGQFLTMASDLLGICRKNGAQLKFDFFHYLLTRYEPNDIPQQEIGKLLRGTFGDHVLQSPAVKSTAFSDAGLSKQTLYEINSSTFARGTYSRAMESLLAVNSEIEGLINKTWGRI